METTAEVHKCITEHCDNDAPLTWFCPLHYHLKEMNYAMADLWNPPNCFDQYWIDRSVERLEAGVKYIKSTISSTGRAAVL